MKTTVIGALPRSNELYVRCVETVDVDAVEINTDWAAWLWVMEWFIDTDAPDQCFSWREL